MSASPHARMPYLRTYHLTCGRSKTDMPKPALRISCGLQKKKKKERKTDGASLAWQLVYCEPNWWQKGHGVVWFSKKNSRKGTNPLSPWKWVYLNIIRYIKYQLCILTNMSCIFLQIKAPCSAPLGVFPGGCPGVGNGGLRRRTVSRHLGKWSSHKADSYAQRGDVETHQGIGGLEISVRRKTRNRINRNLIVYVSK